MAPKLRVLVSSSSAYPPKIPLTVNSPTPTPISTPSFKGEISVYVKDYTGEHKGGDGAEYFSERSGMTYAIVVRGEFLDHVTADEVVFGNVFEKPIRDHLPWGTSIGIKFMYFIDPTVEHDVYADRPWALSPAMATMNYLSISDSGAKESGSTISENVDVEGVPSDVKGRRAWFGDIKHRKTVQLKDKHVGMEFANGLLDFNTLSATLPPPFRLSIPLLKYWDGQPVTYICQKKGTPGEHVYFAVAFEIVDEEAKKELEARGGKVLERRHSRDEKEDEDEDEGAEAVSDDVD